MIRIVILGIALLTCIACDPIEPEKDEVTNEVVDSSATNNISADAAAYETSSIKVVRATFESAVVYAGATDYYFKLEGKEEYYNFRVSNVEWMTAEELEAERDYLEGLEINIMVPLLDPSEDIEGPPGANTTYQGMLFELLFDGEVEDKLLEVRPVD